MKNFKNYNAVSSVLAILLIVAITVGASVATYAWVFGFVSHETQRVGVIPVVDRVCTDQDYVGGTWGGQLPIIVFTIRNIGNTMGYIDNNILYWSEEAGNYANVTTPLTYQEEAHSGWYPTNSPIPVNPGENVNIAVQLNYTSGKTYYFKIVFTNSYALEVSKTI